MFVALTYLGTVQKRKLKCSRRTFPVDEAWLTENEIDKNMLSKRVL